MIVSPLTLSWNPVIGSSTRPRTSSKNSGQLTSKPKIVVYFLFFQLLIDLCKPKSRSKKSAFYIILTSWVKGHDPAMIFEIIVQGQPKLF